MHQFKRFPFCVKTREITICAFLLIIKLFQIIDSFLRILNRSFFLRPPHLLFRTASWCLPIYYFVLLLDAIPSIILYCFWEYLYLFPRFLLYFFHRQCSWCYFLLCPRVYIFRRFCLHLYVCPLHLNVIYRQRLIFPFFVYYFILLKMVCRRNIYLLKSHTLGPTNTSDNWSMVTYGILTSVATHVWRTIKSHLSLAARLHQALRFDFGKDIYIYIHTL